MNKIKIKKKRIDQILLEKKLVETRNKAQALIMAGDVYVNDIQVKKSGDFFKNDIYIKIIEKNKWVSRGALKLEPIIISQKIFVKDSLFNIGELFIQKDLSLTLQRIAKFGYKEFYIGKTGEQIIKCMNRTDGIITKQDLIKYNPVEREPISFQYRDYTIHSMPPPSSGGITLANILNQLEYISLDLEPTKGSSYYRLRQTDYNGMTKTFNPIVITIDEDKPHVLDKIINMMGQEVNENYNGLIIEIYKDGTSTKKYNSENK